jgi:hypothetical protein
LADVPERADAPGALTLAAVIVTLPEPSGTAARSSAFNHGRRLNMYIGLGGLILLIIVLVVLF